jgi:carboxylesterase type B
VGNLVSISGFVAWGPPASVVLSTSNLGNRQPSEDCLLLDIYAPAEPASSKLPVLLYIYGGGYDGGSSTQLPFARIMSAALGQFIVVNIQYYLAGFGFLGGAEVQETGTLNAGLLDQRFDMQWCSAILQVSVETQTRRHRRGLSGGWECLVSARLERG